MSTTPIKILTPDGKIHRNRVPDDESACLAALQKLVGGNIEVVPLPGTRYLVLNAEGKILSLSPNPIATKLAHDAESIRIDDYIAGTAILAPRKLFG